MTSESWIAWELIDAVEQSQGKKAGKPGEYIVAIKMLAVEIGAGLI